MQLATGPLGAENGGRYFVDGEPRDVLPYARDEKSSRRLWDDSAELVGLPH